MKKLKLFIENFLVYGLGGVISKVIPLIMVPVITRLMPDTGYYGISDMDSTIVSIATYLAIFGMYDAMYRMFFEKEDESFKRDICTTALTFVLGTSVVVALLLVLAKGFLAQWFFGNKEYAYLIYISAMAAFVGGSNTIVSAPTRMENKRTVFLAANTLGPLLSYSVSIPLLIKGYYVIALPLANLISAAVLEVSFLIMNRKWFGSGRFKFDYLKQMLKIAIPLLPNFLIYWVFNSSNKLMITNLLSIGAAGIFSVGAKLGHASQLVYTAFAGGWQYFAFATMKEKDQVKSNSLIFEYLGVISFTVSMFVFALAKPIYELLFEGEYVSGYIVSPYLFLAPLLQMLFQVAANQFLVIKKTWPNMLILSVGAIVNVVINLLLIPAMGIEAAAVATLVGYAISDVICVIVLCKMKLMEMSRRFLSVSGIMLGFILAWRLVFVEHVLLSVLLAIGVSVVYLLLYKRDIINLLKGLKHETA